MKSVMHYEKPGSWIREVFVDDSRIHMKTVNSGTDFSEHILRTRLSAMRRSFRERRMISAGMHQTRKGRSCLYSLTVMSMRQRKRSARHLRSLRRAVRQSNRSQRQLVRLRSFMRMDEDDSSDVLWTLRCGAGSIRSYGIRDRGT